MSNGTLAATLTTDQITALRDTWVRDHYDKTTNPITAVSRYNQANARNFFTDTDLQGIYADMVTDKQVWFSAMWQDKHDERTLQGDSEATATSVADAAVQAGVYRIVTAECLERMVCDPAYRMSLQAGGDIAMLKVALDGLTQKIGDYRSWVRSRQGIFGSIELERR
jgi:hypothetical protein